MDVVRAFMTLPEITQYAAEFGADIENTEFVSDERNAWFIYTHKDEPIGLIGLNLITGCMAMFHPYVFKNHKRRYLTMVRMFISEFFDKMPVEMAKLNAAIPVTFPAAIKAAHKAGMREEGLDRLSYLSSTGPVDRVLLGITREELKCQA